MGPLRSALAVARRQRRRRGVFVSLYRPCCGAAAAIARRRRGPAAPPPPRPPARSLARPPSYGALGLRRWHRQRPARWRLHFPSFVSALEASSWPDRSPGRGPPSALRPSRHGWPQPRGDLRSPASAPASLKCRHPATARAARSPCSMGVGPLPTPLGLPILQPAQSRNLPCGLASVPRRPAAPRSLPVRASPPLVSVSTEWRRRRCCGCE